MSRGEKVVAYSRREPTFISLRTNGTQVEVTGAKLDEHKGHEAEVGGERRSRTIATSVSGAASSGAPRPVIGVKSFKDLGPNRSKTSN